MRTFKINEDWSVVADTAKTRNGFKHTAVLMDKDGRVRDEVKVNYLNRTWERYEYETALNKLLEKTKYLDVKDREQFKHVIAQDNTDWSDFKATAMVAKLGEVLADTPEAKNAWKARMLKAGLNIELPEDWEQLSEEEKEKRLNQVIALAQNAGKEKHTLLSAQPAKLPNMLGVGKGWHKESARHRDARYKGMR